VCREEGYLSFLLAFYQLALLEITRIEVVVQRPNMCVIEECIVG